MTDAPFSHRSPRVPTRGSAALREVNGRRQAAATLVDVSRTGLGLRALDGLLPAFASVGAIVSIEAELPFGLGSFYASAEVMRFEADGRIGVRFVDDLPSSLGALHSFLQQRPVRVLFIACRAFEEVAMRVLPSTQVFPAFVDTLDEGRAFLAVEEVATLVVGDAPPADTLSFIHDNYANERPLSAPALVLAAGADLEPFSGDVSAGHIFFITHRLPQSDAMPPLVQSSLESYWSRVRAQEVSRGAKANTVADEMFAQVLQHADNVSRAFGAASLRAAAEEGIKALTGASRAYILFHEDADEVLWAPDSESGEAREISSAAGIVSFTARTGLGTMLARLHDDARYERDADAPQGTGSERGMTEAVVGVGRRAIAVLVAHRNADEKPFSASDQIALRLFSAQLAGPVARLAGTLESERRALQAGSVFNPRALEALKEGERAPGQMLAIHSRTLDNVFALLLVFAVVLGLFLVLVKVKAYGTGQALVRLQSKVGVTAHTSGVVKRVLANRGDHVRAGDGLCVLDDSRELAELARVENDLEQQLIRWLRDPTDTEAAKMVAQTRAQSDLARANVALRVVTASVDGTVNDLHVYPGQLVGAGDMVASLAPTGSTGYSLIAFFPGMHRPRAEIGSRMRLELNGYRFAYVDLKIESLSDSVIGPSEAKRLLGPEHRDSLTLAGPVFVAAARMPGDGFLLDDETFHYHDGLTAIAHVELRAEPIIMLLIPSLRRFTHNWFSDGS